MLSAVSAAAIEFGLASTASAVLSGEAGSYTVHQETYYSAPITLEAGHMVFTDSGKTPLKMPSGEYAITYFIGDIVFADTHQPAPLSEVYDHHWIAVSSNHRNQFCKGSIEYVFGIGAESRHSPVSFSPGFGYHVANGTYWGANIHLLRTEGLAGDNPYRAAKECIECYYSPGKGEGCTPAYNGTFRCCGEFNNATAAKSSCAVGPNPPAARDYQLRYTFNYTRDVARLRPVYVGTLAAPSCAVFYSATQHVVPKNSRFVAPQLASPASSDAGRRSSPALHTALYTPAREGGGRGESRFTRSQRLRRRSGAAPKSPIPCSPHSTGTAQRNPADGPRALLSHGTGTHDAPLRRGSPAYGRAQHLAVAQRTGRVHLLTHLRHGARRRRQREGAACLPPQCTPAVYLRSGARPPACSALPRLQASPSAATTTVTTGHFHRHHCAAAQGYLVHMSHCIDSSTGVLELRKGDEIAIDGHYFVGSNDPRLLYSDGTHLNVMR